MNATICDNCKKAQQTDAAYELHRQDFGAIRYSHEKYDWEFCSVECIAEWSEKVATEARIAEEVRRREREKAKWAAVQEVAAEQTAAPGKKGRKR